jgi:putative membrane-bound dehydrogenase-like protein
MKSRYWLLLGVLLWLAGSVHAQMAPEKTLASFKVSEGLEISVWASEPMMVNPTCMDIDNKGRVWVVESINYRSKLRNQPLRRAEGDRILILEDSKGTGQADKVTVFYQAPEILAPLGIAVLPHIDGPGCTVYVCQSPDIMVFEDKEGDGKADGPPRKLLSGFKGIDHDHGVHGILLGPDGKLYFSVGDQGVQNLVDKFGKKWTSNGTDCRAGTNWRCDLDGKNLELIAHNFRNQYEPCVDSFGTVYVSDNDDDGNQQTRICYVMPGGNYGYHHSPKVSHWNEEMPGIVPKILRTYFGSPTGICVYEGSLFPSQYQGQLLHTDAGPRHLRCYHLTPEGAGYKVEREDMVQSTDNWFRPSDVCVAPDGAVFIADWYDPGVGGHGMGDIKQGRVYRLAPSGNKPSVPKMDLQSKEGLTAALASPNLSMRAAAIAKIHSLGLPKALEVLEPAALQKDNPFLRARALWQLGRLGNLRHVSQAFEDADPRFRILAMRILADTQDHSPADYIPDWKNRLIKDPSPAVRREALVLLRNVDPTKAAPLIHALAHTHDGKDRFFLSAVGVAVGHLDTQRREVLLNDFDKQYPGWNEQVASLTWELRPPQMLPLLEKRLSEGKTTANQRSQIVDILAGSSEANSGMILLKAWASEKSPEVSERIYLKMKEYLPGKWKGLQNSPELSAIVQNFLEMKGYRLEALALIAAAERSDFLPQVADLAANTMASGEVRAAAIRALGSFKDKLATDKLAALVMSKENDALRSEALAALGKQGTPAAQALLQEVVQDKSTSLFQRQSALAGLAGSKEGSAWLLASYGEKKLSGDLTSDLARLLRNSPFGDLKKQAQAILPAPPKLDPKNLPSIPAVLARKGNPDRGRQIMQLTLKNDAACLKCHVIQGVGGKAGPELSVIGSKASRENLLESILYPHRAVAHQFETWVIETKQGLAINGIIAEETPQYLVLRDANVKEYKIDKKDIESRTKSPLSIMPDNLILHLPEDDLLDIVDYLYTLKSPALTPAVLSRDEGPVIITPTKKGKNKE